MSNSLCFQDVRVFRDGRFSEVQDFHVCDGRWVEGPVAGAQVINGRGCWILPGMFALGVDFQEPERDDIYTLKDGFEAMRRGGFSAALYESHANPLDDVPKLKSMLDAGSRSGLDVKFLGALSVGNKGKALSEMLELAAGGAVGFGDGNELPSSLRFLRLALEYASMTGLRCYFQPTDISLKGKGCVHEGHFADALGLKGIPSQAETIAVHQLLELAGWLKVPVHLKQITCAESLELVRAARLRGVDVTCDVSVYHLLLDDTGLFELDTNAHLIPPPRTRADRDALWAGLADSTIQAISCAHVPVLPQDKEVHFEDAMPGAVSLEIAFAALLQESQARLPGGVSALVALLTEGPANVVGVSLPRLEPGLDSPWFLFDPACERVVEPRSFAGKVQNSPLLGRKVQGCLRGTCFAGYWRASEV